VVAEDNEEVKKTGDGKAVKDIDGKEPHHGGTICLQRSKEEVINEESRVWPGSGHSGSMT
jgi:hypothetical protein